MSATDDLLRAILARCERISGGVEELRPLLAPVLPTDHASIDMLETMTRIASVALLKRVEQLQDMLARLVRAVASWELIDVAEMTRRDLANWMEQRRFVDDAAQWITLTELRNRLVHEYPIDDAEQIRRVNQSWEAASALQAIFRRIPAYLANKGFSA